MASPVEEIKSRLSVQDVVGSYVRLIKAGANFKANCPFHNEKTPSFFVSPARETWHCFGCNAGGDIFEFVKQMEGVEFPEALEILASRAGIVLKRENPNLTSERKRLFDLIEEATKYFEGELKGRSDAEAYLEARGVKDETLKSFRIGYAKYGWDGLFNHLSSKSFKPEEMEKAGLILKSPNPNARTKFYDRFRARIIFPIAESSGKIVGFSGRIFEPAVPAADIGKMGGKYINSPQTALFDKSRVLYLWDRAKNDVRRENVCILVEGQMDALMSHQAGVKNVVAVSGTALTREHLGMIKRLSSRLFLSFDADLAGESATRRSVDLALASGLDVSIINSIGAKDPADLIKKNPNAWQDAVKGAHPVIEFFLENLKLKSGGDLHKLRQNANTQVLPYVALITNEIERAHWVLEVSRSLALREEPVWEEVKKLITARKPERYVANLERNIPSGASSRTRLDLIEERLIGIAAWKSGIFLDELKKCDKINFAEDRQILFEYVISNKVAQAPNEVKASVERVALEAELSYGEIDSKKDIGQSDKKAKEEFELLASELQRERAKARLEILASKIRDAEATGEKKNLEVYLVEFKMASEFLNKRE